MLAWIYQHHGSYGIFSMEKNNSPTVTSPAYHGVISSNCFPFNHRLVSRYWSHCQAPVLNWTELLSFALPKVEKKSGTNMNMIEIWRNSDASDDEMPWFNGFPIVFPWFHITIDEWNTDTQHLKLLMMSWCFSGRHFCTGHGIYRILNYPISSTSKSDPSSSSSSSIAHQPEIQQFWYDSPHQVWLMDSLSTDPYLVPIRDSYEIIGCDFG